MTTTIFEPELTWIDGAFKRGVSISVELGVITAIGDHGSGKHDGAFLPGFVNAHSHAFQRGLRGLGETFHHGRDSFWGWREEMYKLVDRSSIDSLRENCVQSFTEMRQAGITSVGEFHYLHHDSEEDYAFDQVVLDAASEVGIRIVLLHACYMHGGFDTPLAGGQLRFATPTIDRWWEQVDSLSSNVDGLMQRIGTVAHSVRAVDIDSIVAIFRGALHRGLPMHIHVEEQRQEIAACLKHHGKTPMGLLNEALDVSPMITAVHCTHTSAVDMNQWLEHGGNVCLCPLTEANLADGICEVSRVVKRGGSISLGTDSNARISMIEEMRWMEYAQRLVHEERGVCVDASGSMAEYVFNAATINGARSLGLHAGVIEVGKLADFAVIDLRHPQLAGATDNTLLAAICCGGDNSIITQTIVGGQ